MVLMRMMQGLSVGGEYTSSIVYLAENAPAGRRAFFSSWSMFGAVGGILMGSAVGALLHRPDLALERDPHGGDASLHPAELDRNREIRNPALGVALGQRISYNFV